jgi:hypothetical protein
MIQEAIKEQGEALMSFGNGIMHFFIHRNGQAYVPVKHELPMGEVKQCFANSARFIMGNSERDGYRYCEGLAVRRSLGMLMEHAWVVDRLGNAYDLTWRDTEECEYFGVAFEKKELMSELNRNGVYGLLNVGMYNLRLMQKMDKSLMDEFNKEVERRQLAFKEAIAKAKTLVIE